MNFGGKQVIDVEKLLRDSPGNGIPTAQILGTMANHFALRSGANPSTGRLLMKSVDYNALERPNIYTLTLDSGLAIPNLYITAGTRLTSSADTSDAAPVLVDISDVRQVLTYGISRAYNLLDQQGVSISAPWTWTTMLADLWNNANLPGTFAAPAILPTAAPQNYAFWGQVKGLKVRDALEYVLNQIGYTISHGIDGTFSIVALGQTPVVRTWPRIYDGRDEVPDLSNLPFGITTGFRWYPAPIPGGSPYYYITTYAASLGYSPIGNRYIQIEDQLGALGSGGVPTNLATLTTRADERAAAYFKWFLRSKRRNVVYKGYRVYSPVGGDACEVIYQERGMGPQTEIVAGPTSVDDKIEPLPFPRPTFASGQFNAGGVTIPVAGVWTQVTVSPVLKGGTYFFSCDVHSFIQAATGAAAGPIATVDCKYQTLAGVDVSQVKNVHEGIPYVVPVIGVFDCQNRPCNCITQVAEGDRIKLVALLTVYDAVHFIGASISDRTLGFDGAFVSYHRLPS